MRSHKPYTNVTFTRRVDHLAGRRHAPKAPGEPRICRTCGAVYVHRRWVPAGDARARSDQPVFVPRETVCPACRMVAEGRARGEVVLRGAFLAAHRHEIEQLLNNEAARARVDNPLGRIGKWDWIAPDRLTLWTTTEHLAKRLGHAVEKAFAGSVRYVFSHENKFARVIWNRD